MKLFKIYFVLFYFFTLNFFSQTACSSSAAFCANNTAGTTFPAGTNTSASAGPDYGCLFSQPNPAWYYFQVSQTGTITIGIGGTGGGDVDFICWGPFSSPTGNCGNLTAANTIDCSYSASATETCTINNAITGEYYELLITNFSNITQNINFNQVGGNGSTNCGLIAPVTSATICAGSSGTISANTNLTNPTFIWNPGGLTTQTIVVSPSVTTVYTVTVNGLDASSTPTTITNTGTVTISPPQPIAITPSLSTICLGQSVGLSTTGSGPFVWSASNGTNPASVANVTVTPSSTTTYTVLSGTGTCTASAVATVSISLTPSISITPSLSTICVGQTVTLSSSGAAPFSWTASSGTNPPSTASVTVSPSSTTTYSVLSGSGTCTAAAVAIVSVAPTPSITITPSLSTICLGQSVGLSSTGSGPFAWTASTGANPPSTASITVSPTTTTTYSVLSGTGTCTATAVATVSISAIPSISITPSSTAICVGQNVSLTSSGSAPFTWIASSGANPPSMASITVTPTSSTTYTVLSGSGTCTNLATASVSVTTVTTSVTASSPFYCIGVPSVSLSANGAATYSWSPALGLSATFGTMIAATPSVSTIYSVTGYIGTCSSSQTVSITVPITNTITAVTSNSLICAGGNGSTLTANGANTFTWVPGALTTASLAVNPTTTTTYSVLGQTANGCFAVPAVVTVSVLPALNQTLTATSRTVCLNDSTTITASPIISGLTYTWMPTLAIHGLNDSASIVALPTSSASVIYTVMISNGVCMQTDTFQVRVLTPPVPNFITLNNDTVCVGGCVTFSSTTTGSQPMNYQWLYQSGVGTSSVGVHPEACYPSAGSFSVTMIVANACGVDTFSKSNYITVFNYPNLVVAPDTTIKIGQSGFVYASGGQSYYWSPNINNTIVCPTCSISVVQPTITTQYIVVASNSIYCKVQDTVVVNVDIDCGDFFVPNAFSPNGDGLNDLINVHGRCIATFNLQIFDRWGEKIFETSSLNESWDGSFRGQKMDTGVFVYKADGVSITGESFKFKGNITLIR